MTAEEPRRIWLCADDYGIAPGVSHAIRDLASRGRLNATSVMVLSPNFDRAEAAALDRINADGRKIAIGLHFTLTAPFRPLALKFAPLKGDMFLPIGANMRKAVLRQLDRDALADEATAQLEAFAASFGRPPDLMQSRKFRRCGSSEKGR